MTPRVAQTSMRAERATVICIRAWVPVSGRMRMLIQHIVEYRGQGVPDSYTPEKHTDNTKHNAALPYMQVAADKNIGHCSHVVNKLKSH